MAARGQNTSASLNVDPALHWHICVHTGGGRGYCPSLTGWLAVRGRKVPTVQPGKKQATSFRTWRGCERKETRAIRQRGRAELITEDLTSLEDEDLVSLDGVEVIVHGQEDLGGNERGEGLVHRVSCLQIPIPTIYLRFIFKTSHILLALSSVSVIHINCFRRVKQNSKHGTRSFCFSVWKCVCCMCKWTKRNDNHTRKDPNMAMEERKCQMSWSSKNESRIQSLLCSRDSAGVFWVPREKHTRSTNVTVCRD